MTDVRVGFNPDFAPFCAARNGQAAGLVVDRLRPALAAAGLRATWQPLALPEMAAALAARDVDALAGVGMAAGRAGAMDFSAPLVETGGAWFVRAGAPWPTDAALEGSEAADWSAVTPAAGPLAAPVGERFPALVLKTCADYTDALDLVASGDVQAAALNLHVGNALVRQGYSGQIAPAKEPFLKISLALAVPAGDPANLLPGLNRALQA